MKAVPSNLQKSASLNRSSLGGLATYQLDLRRYESFCSSNIYMSGETFTQQREKEDGVIRFLKGWTWEGPGEEHVLKLSSIYIWLKAKMFPGPQAMVALGEWGRSSDWELWFPTDCLSLKWNLERCPDIKDCSFWLIDWVCYAPPPLSLFPLPNLNICRILSLPVIWKLGTINVLFGFFF